MTSRSPFTFRHVIESRHRRSTPERYSDPVRGRGGLVSAPGNLISAKQKNESSSKKVLAKLLLKVNIERSLGPVHVILSPENTVKDLVKSAIDIYVKERRRPLLKQVDSDRFELHYSQFSLESLKPEEKLINLGSRNFFLCSKPSSAVNSSSTADTKMAI
ncbi:hypothetical protein SADUNF_Sadunf03G0084800 [Salix dunnii]|uniref:DUF7054 domain-containing protein n=1 Tax=Salix dunnii TaxID=1413687 RepID=A0A835N495_9ROSI|nr:hypothetical protein SADUNF_Sadunf03G0084800 [Salix dunnii]